MPWHDAWEARNEITRMLPLVTSELTGPRRGSGTARNHTLIRLKLDSYKSKTSPAVAVPGAAASTDHTARPPPAMSRHASAGRAPPARRDPMALRAESEGEGARPTVRPY
jgi:hypothetical protein